MQIEIINTKEYSAERVFFCNWMELCGYLVIGRDYVVDRPTHMQAIVIGGDTETGVFVGYAHERIVLEITRDLLTEYSEHALWECLVAIMNYISNEEKDEELLYNDYKDDRSDVIVEIARLYVQYRIYLHCFILNRTYSTIDFLLFSIKDIYKCIERINSWKLEKEGNSFLEFVILFLYSRIGKAQQFMNRISWSESERMLEKCDELLGRMKMLHYQDTLYLAKSHICENLPGKNDEVWENLRLIRSRHYYVVYKLGNLREKHWKRDNEAKQYYLEARVNMPEYFRADYKLAVYYEEHGCFELAERFYNQVICKIWCLPEEVWKSEEIKLSYINGLIDKEKAKYFTILDVEYLIKTWNRLVRTLREILKSGEEKQRNQAVITLGECFKGANLNYQYLDYGIRNSVFLKKIFSGEIYHEMSDTILNKIEKGKRELQKLY